MRSRGEHVLDLCRKRETQTGLVPFVFQYLKAILTKLGI